MINKHVELRLGVAFAILIALLAGIGQLGLRRMHEINDTLSDITGRRSAKLQLAQEALMLSNQNSRITMEVFLVQDGARIDGLLAARSENTNQISELMAKIASRCESEEEKQLLATVHATRQVYVESYLRSLHLLVNEKQHDAAAAAMVNETLPAIRKYHTALNGITEFQRNQVDMAAKQAQADYTATSRLASLLIMLAVAVAVGIAVFTTRHAQKSYRQEAVAREGAECELQRSEERMRMAMEAAKIGFWDWDVIKDEQVWSDTCKALLGLRPDSTANFQVLMNSVHPDDRKMIHEQINAAIQEKRDYGMEFRVVWPDGSVHWEVVRGHAFYDNAGRTTRIAGIAMDIDQRKHADERLHLQGEALEAAANAIVITDYEGKMVWVNRAFTTMTGYSKEEALSKNLRLLKSGAQPES